MTKNEIKQFAAIYGIEAVYSGKEEIFYFHPVLLNNLQNLAINQKEKLDADPTNVKLVEEYDLTLKRIEPAKERKAAFEETRVFTEEMNYHEASTV